VRRVLIADRDVHGGQLLGEVKWQKFKISDVAALRSLLVVVVIIRLRAQPPSWDSR
jgi:hypothetical protein